jgi:hypothetical protein
MIGWRQVEARLDPAARDGLDPCALGVSPSTCPPQTDGWRPPRPGPRLARLLKLALAAATLFALAGG